MPSILIVFATTDGQTRKIARFLAACLRDAGVSVQVVRAGTEEVTPGDHAATIVAGSIHVGGYQRELRKWVREHATQLASRPSALLTVCLGILQQDDEVRADLDRIVQRFRDESGWNPARHLFVAGALRYTQYGWLKRLVMRRIAGHAGGSTDTSRDHEYTDWEALRRFADEFAEQLLPAPPAWGRVREPTVAVCGEF